MKLSEGKKGHKYHVNKIELPVNLERRLEVIGMTDGATVEILEKKKSGSMSVKFRGTRFAIGKNIAKGIDVGGESTCRKL